MRMQYKGVIFDNYEKGEQGLEAHVCSHCAKNHLACENVIGSTKSGVCSVKGCYNYARSLIRFDEGSPHPPPPTSTGDVPVDPAVAPTPATSSPGCRGSSPGTPGGCRADLR